MLVLRIILALVVEIKRCGVLVLVLGVDCIFISALSAVLW